MAKDLERAKELLLGAVDTVLKMADHSSSQSKDQNSAIVHLHHHCRVQAVLVVIHTLLYLGPLPPPVVFNQLDWEQERPVPLLWALIGLQELTFAMIDEVIFDAN